MKNIYIYIFTLIVVLLPLPVSAGKLDISHSLVKSTVDSYVVSAGISDQAGPLDFNAEYHYGKIADLVSSDDGEVGVGYDPVINDKWSLWSDVRAGYNNVLGIDFENFIGFGPKYYILKGDKRKISLSTGVLYHYRSGDEKGKGRYSHRLKYEDEWFSGVWFHQPNLKDSSDYITKGEARIGFSKTLSIFYKEEYRSLIDTRETERGIVFTFLFDSMIGSRTAN